MDKNIGFNRNIALPWLDAAACFIVEGSDPATVRARLDPVVGAEIASPDNRRKAIDILIHIWGKTQGSHPSLHAAAVGLYPQAPAGDRVWLHYGLTLLAYPFFRQTAAAIGRLTRQQEIISSRAVKERLVAERGQLGSQSKAIERVCFSLRHWGLLADAERQRHYRPLSQPVAAEDRQVQAWLLACALCAHPAEEIPFADLVRLPELFAFRFTLSLDDLRRDGRFAVQRQGGGWDAVRLAELDRLQ